jgi:hypothetical protein
VIGKSSLPIALAPWLALWACSGADRSEPPVGQARSAILGGRESGADENANVYVETLGDGNPLRCSGRIIAPGLAVTARHCLLKRRSTGVLCTENGDPVDLSDTTDLRPEPAERITVYIGESRSAFRSVAVRDVLTIVDVTICRSDVAFLVLAEIGLDVRTPIRRAPVSVAEKITVTGWGYTTDGTDVLPDTRFTREGIPVTQVGPAFIPAGTFAIAGNTVCFGDSGASASIDGAIVGTYSRIDGTTACSLEQARNIFASVAAEPRLLERAYAAIGEVPWYAGEPPPWRAARETERAAPAEARGCSMTAPGPDLLPHIPFFAVLALRRRRRH